MSGELKRKTGKAPAGRERNVRRYRYPVTRAQRAALKRHRACVIWLTGLSGSGKSSIAGELERGLHGRGVHTQVLDGDNLRLGLNADLGFSRADRRENIRRAGEVAKLSVEAGLVVIAAFVSPYRADREAVRRLFVPGEFIEVFVDCPLAVCRQRDPKGFYQRAEQGSIRGFTGVQAPFEAPTAPELVLRTDRTRVPEAACKIMARLEKANLIPSVPRRRPAGPKERACS